MSSNISPEQQASRVSLAFLQLSREFVQLMERRESVLTGASRIAAVADGRRRSLEMRNGILATTGALSSMIREQAAERERACAAGSSADELVRLFSLHSRQLTATCDSIMASIETRTAAVRAQIAAITPVQVPNHPRSQPLRSIARVPPPPPPKPQPQPSMSLGEASEKISSYLTAVLSIATKKERASEAYALVDAMMFGRIEPGAYEAAMCTLLKCAPSNGSTVVLLSRVIGVLTNSDMIPAVLQTARQKFAAVSDSIDCLYINCTMLSRAVACASVYTGLSAAAARPPLVASDGFAHMLSEVAMSHMRNMLGVLSAISEHRTRVVAPLTSAPSVFDLLSRHDKLLADAQHARAQRALLKSVRSEKAQFAAVRDMINAEKQAVERAHANDIALALFGSRKRKLESGQPHSHAKRRRATLIVYVKQEPVDPDLGVHPTVFVPDPGAMESLRQQQQPPPPPVTSSSHAAHDTPRRQTRRITLADLACMLELNPGLAKATTQYAVRMGM
jgi:hypothetical protein